MRRHRLPKGDPVRHLKEQVVDQLSDLKPPVPPDAKTLRDYHAGLLGEKEERHVTELVATYRTWYDSSIKVLGEQVRDETSEGS
jgi:hypothetical protein